MAAIMRRGRGLPSASAMRSASGMAGSCQGAPSSSSAAAGAEMSGISAAASPAERAMGAGAVSVERMAAKKPFSHARCSAVKGALSGRTGTMGGRDWRLMGRVSGSGERLRRSCLALGPGSHCADAPCVRGAKPVSCPGRLKRSGAQWKESRDPAQNLAQRQIPSALLPHAAAASAFSASGSRRRVKSAKLSPAARWATQLFSRRSTTAGASSAGTFW